MITDFVRDAAATAAIFGFFASDFTDHLAAAGAEPIVPGLVLEAMLQAQRDPDLARLLGDDAESEQAGIPLSSLALLPPMRSTPRWTSRGLRHGSWQ
jgi:hypothetical protein